MIECKFTYTSNSLSFALWFVFYSNRNSYYDSKYKRLVGIQYCDFENMDRKIKNIIYIFRQQN